MAAGQACSALARCACNTGNDRREEFVAVKKSRGMNVSPLSQTGPRVHQKRQGPLSRPLIEWLNPAHSSQLSTASAPNSSFQAFKIL